MSWNYRVIQREERMHTSVEPVCVIATVFYDAQGRVTQWAAEPTWPVGDSPDALRSDLTRMWEALDKPVMVERDGSLVPVEDSKQ